MLKALTSNQDGGAAAAMSSAVGPFLSREAPSSEEIEKESSIPAARGQGLVKGPPFREQHKGERYNLDSEGDL